MNENYGKWPSELKHMRSEEKDKYLNKILEGADGLLEGSELEDIKITLSRGKARGPWEIKGQTVTHIRHKTPEGGFDENSWEMNIRHTSEDHPISHFLRHFFDATDFWYGINAFNNSNYISLNFSIGNYKISLIFPEKISTCEYPVVHLEWKLEGSEPTKLKIYHCEKNERLDKIIGKIIKKLMKIKKIKNEEISQHILTE